MSQFDLKVLNQFLDVQQIYYRPTLNSTNDFALDNLNLVADSTPTLILTDKQTAGRGRSANQWWATTGALTFSLVENTSDLQLPPERLSTLSLAAGLATQRVLAGLTSIKVQVKWPNDVYISQQKCCGILIEQKTFNHQAFLVIGVGINANHDLNSAPADISAKAISLQQIVGQTVDLTALLQQWLQAWNQTVSELRNQPQAFFAQLNASSLLNGRFVRICWPDKTTSGIVEHIDSAGRLLLATSSGLQAITSGSVELLDGTDNFSSHRRAES